MYQLSKHPSGVTIVSAEMPHMSSVSLGIWVSVGGRCEPARLCGASHFIEHMLFKGTKRRNAKQISQDVEGIGGYLNAFTTEENTCFYTKAGGDQLDHLWDVLADMFLHSSFDPVELEKERNVIKEEYAMYLDQPQHHVQELLNETLWPEHPLGRPLTGTPETLNTLSRRQLVSYMRANYGTQNVVIAAAGQVRHRKLVKLVSKLASRFPKASRSAFAGAPQEQTAPRLTLFTKDTEQTQLAMGIRACSRHDDRRYPLRLLNVILGENMSSRLFQTVREDNGLAYSICSNVSLFDDTGTITISAGLDTDKLEKTLKLIMAELAVLTTQVPSTGELRRARDYIFGQLDLSLENTENQMTWLGEQYLGYGKIVSPDEVKKALSKVTPRDIRAAARDFFRPDRLSVALVSPLKDKKLVMPVISKICV